MEENRLELTKKMEEVQIFNYYDKDGWIVAEEPKGAFFDDRPMITDPKNGMIINFSRYPEGFYKSYHRHKCSHGILVIDGRMKTDDGREYGPGAFVWDPAGFCGGHGAADHSDCKFLFVSNKPFDIEFLDEANPVDNGDMQLGVFDVYENSGWTKIEDFSGSSVFVKEVAKDPETGMWAGFLRCPKGFSRKNKTNPCALGVYVIKGEWRTEKGEFGPGSFIWYPAASLQDHGATEKEDCVVLMIANSPMDMDCF